MVAKAGAGPPPIHHKDLNAQNLAEAITFCCSQAATDAARRLAEVISAERGVEAAVESFHRHLPVPPMECDVLSDQPATWSYNHRKKHLKLSKAVAQTLVSAKVIDPKKLKM